MAGGSGCAGVCRGRWDGRGLRIARLPGGSGFLERTEAQLDRFQSWVEQHRRRRIVIVECGAGTAVPVVRSMSERLVRQFGARLIRLNPREPEVPDGQIGLPCGALEGLTAISENLKN